MRTVIAIDGPAGSGKSTVARLLSARTGLIYVDTGATYRLVAIEALRDGIALTDATAVSAIAKRVAADTRVGPDGLVYDGRVIGEEIRTPEVSAAASVIAAHPEVRGVMVPFQRGLVHAHGAVVEGRDIGTVVWPEATVKAYVDARPEVRAARRAREEQRRDDATGREVAARDARDASRPVGAMRAADDAVRIDTSDMTPEEVVATIMAKLPERAVPRPNRVYRFFRVILRFLLFKLFRMEVVGADRIPASGPAILAPNHRSLIDHPAIGVVTNRPIRFMAKEELFASRFGAAVLRLLGAFPVRRGKPDRASLRTALELLEQGHLVGIYPEGTRTPTSRFEELEEGLAYVALKAGVPIVPIAISGTEAVFPRDRKLPRIVKIRMHIGEPFTLGGPVDGLLARRRVREATAEAHRRLLALMNDVEPAS